MRVVFAITLIFSLLVAGSSLAREGEEHMPGELHVRHNTRFLRVIVEGEEWDSVEYAGRTTQIKGLDRGPASLSILLEPVDDQLAPVTIEVKATDFRRKMKRRVVYYVASKRVIFPKRKDAPDPEPTEPDTEPEKKPRVLPVPDKDDEL